jgi:hypothetical protein
MEKQKNLTNDYLMKSYSNNFSLALTAIELAKSQIAAGKETKLGDIFETLARLVPQQNG